MKKKFEKYKETTKYGEIYRKGKVKWTRNLKKEMRIFNRRDLRKLIEIRTGHIKLGAFLNERWKKNITEKCICGKQRETPIHLWNQCEEDEIQRERNKRKEKMKVLQEMEFNRLDNEYDTDGKRHEYGWWFKDRNKWKIEEIIFMDKRYSNNYREDYTKEIIKFMEIYVERNEYYLDCAHGS